jgi:uncharacterized membrane protein
MKRSEIILVATLAIIIAVTVTMYVKSRGMTAESAKIATTIIMTSILSFIFGLRVGSK